MNDFNRKPEEVIVGKLSILDGWVVGDTSGLLDIRFSKAQPASI